jgi:hypothetical protein
MKPQMDNGHLPQRGGTPLRVCPKPFGHAARTDTLRVRVASLKEIRQLPAEGNPPAALVSPHGSVLQINIDKICVAYGTAYAYICG